MAHSQYFYFYSVGMDNLQVIFSIIQKFAAVNLKTEKGREMIKFIEDNYMFIGCESSRIRSAKRKEFQEYEKRLMNYFLELFDYRCTTVNQRMVNKIMTLLKYDGYRDNNKRFRYYLENVLKSKRKMGLPVRESNRKFTKLNRNNSENDAKRSYSQDTLYMNPVFSSSYVQEVPHTNQAQAISSPLLMDFALYDGFDDMMTLSGSNQYLLDGYMTMNKENQNVLETAKSVYPTPDEDIWINESI